MAGLRVKVVWTRRLPHWQLVVALLALLALLTLIGAVR